MKIASEWHFELFSLALVKVLMLSFILQLFHDSQTPQQVSISSFAKKLWFWNSLLLHSIGSQWFQLIQNKFKSTRMGKRVKILSKPMVSKESLLKFCGHLVNFIPRTAIGDLANTLIFWQTYWTENQQRVRPNSTTVFSKPISFEHC